MIHDAACQIAQTDRLTPGCRRCQELTVGDLDDRHFKALMGCTRAEFESYCQHAERLQTVSGHPLPVRIYAFWNVIMDAPALTIQARADRLTRQSRSLSWEPLATR